MERRGVLGFVSRRFFSTTLLFTVGSDHGPSRAWDHSEIEWLRMLPGLIPSVLVPPPLSGLWSSPNKTVLNPGLTEIVLQQNSYSLTKPEFTEVGTAPELFMGRN